VFRKREQAHADYMAGLQANKTRAVALCEEIETAATRSGAALAEGAAQLTGWRTAFEALGELPRGEERVLKARFERAVERIRAAVSRQRAGEKERALADLLEAARHIHAYGWAVARAASPSERDALKGAAETFIAGVSRWPKGAGEALTDAWAGAEGGGGAEHGGDAERRGGVEGGVHTDPETALRMLCIRRELLADLPTPAEDQQLRRDHQMRRLVERMGQRNEAPADDAESLALEWVRVGGVAPDRYRSLLERFRQAGSRAG
jgi:hypothetical protein